MGRRFANPACIADDLAVMSGPDKQRAFGGILTPHAGRRERCLAAAVAIDAANGTAAHCYYRVALPN